MPKSAFCRLENLRAETHKPNPRVLLIVCVIPRTDSPSLCSCPASGGASSILPASALFLPSRDLAISRGTRRAMRPIDFCHPYVPSVYPYLVRSRNLSRLSPRGRLTDSGIRAA
jgi:hypothetical protein